jgi:hypothetical protein
MFTTITKRRKITIAIAVAVAVLIVAAVVVGYLVYKSKSKDNADDSKPWTSLKTIKPTRRSDCSTATYKWTGECTPGKAAWTGTFTVVNNLSVPVNISDSSEGGGGEASVFDSLIPTQTTSGLTFNNYVPCRHEELFVNTAGTPNATTVQKLPTCFTTMIIDDQSNITYK